jgi:molecular chaperone GrpE (heat shock protein)
MQLAESKAQKRAGEVVEVFFEPVQNLTRCLEMSGDDIEAIKQGVSMVLGQFATKMKLLGLREVPGVGSRFDPAVHSALAMTPVQEKEKDGLVLLVHATGYAVGSRVIQPAQVVIGKYEESPTEA